LVIADRAPPFPPGWSALFLSAPDLATRLLKELDQASVLKRC